MAQDTGRNDTLSGCACKVGRASRKYDVEGMNAELRDRHADGASLRELEQFVNETFLESVLREASADVIGNVETIYQSLVDDDVSAGKRTEIRERLARAGVDVSALEADFVSYQTVRTHLRECLDRETDRKRRLTVDDGRGTIEWARSRSEGITARTLERLHRNGRLNAGDVDVFSVIRVSCSTCGVTRTVEAFLEEGGCECSDDRHATDCSTFDQR